MIIRIITTCLTLSLLQSLTAQEVTYARDIAPIIYKHCTSCHRQGEIGPFSLESYEDAVNYASMIRYVTQIKYMPPWKPDPKYQRYQGENFLTEEQIATIGKWVDAGMPRGDAAMEPPLPEFPNGSQVGQPDLVLSYKQHHTIQANNTDEYRYFVLPTRLQEARDLIALEIRPGNKSLVHHTLAWADSTGTARAYDAATPEYGYSGNGQTNVSMLNNQLPGYVPGSKVITLNHGMAQRIPAGSDILLQMHYAPSLTKEEDSTSVNLFFAPQKAKRYIKSNVMIPFFGTLTNGPFVIPANTKKEFHGTWTLPEDASILSVSPHMHLLGTHWKVYATKPNGENVPLIQINNWDFDWQGGYSFKKLIYLPKGSVIHAYAGYDNTENNPSNPNNPPKRVSWGEGTADEMYYLPIHYLSYQPGDENLSLEDISSNTGQIFVHTGTKLYPPMPNPASDKMISGFTLAELSKVYLKAYDLSGHEIRTWIDGQWYHPGYHIYTGECASMAPGTYIIQMMANQNIYTQKLVVVP